ncbi:MAG: aminoacyl-tRNA hydrolase [Alkalispirochaeta sp.]
MKRAGIQDIRLVVLLGNPGRQYAATRHNVAWMVVPYLDVEPESRWKEKFHGRFLKRGETVLLMPETFMNHSGRSVQAAATFFSIPPKEILVVHDDMETPFASVAVVTGGGHRGNNGVRSVAQSLGTGDFMRLRVGVGRPPAGRKPGDWILERFTPDEEARLPEVLTSVADIVRDRANL